MGRQSPVDREVAAVVAHGLLSTTTVLSYSAYALRHFEARLTAAERTEAIASLSSQSAVLDDGLRTLLRDCSPLFADAATAVALAARGIAFVSHEDLPSVLDGLVDRIGVLTTGLQALVRGLPESVAAMLDSLQTTSAERNNG